MADPLRQVEADRISEDIQRIGNSWAMFCQDKLPSQKQDPSNGLTYSELSSFTGVSTSSIGSWLKPSTKQPPTPSIRAIISIAYALDLNPVDVFARILGIFPTRDQDISSDETFKSILRDKERLAQVRLSTSDQQILLRKIAEAIAE